MDDISGSEVSEINLNRDDTSTLSTAESDHPTGLEDQIESPTVKILPLVSNKSDLNAIGTDTETDADEIKSPTVQILPNESDLNEIVTDTETVKSPTVKNLPLCSNKSDLNEIGTDTETDAKTRKWETFTDAEYANPQDIQVPEISFFSFCPYKPKRKIMIANHPLKDNFTEIIKDMINENRGATSTVLIGEDFIIKCHPVILRCHSRLIADGDWRNREYYFREEEVPAKGFELAYNWMRFRELPAIGDMVPMLQVAKQLKIDLLENQCWEVLSHKDVSEKIAMDVFIEARKMPLLNELKLVMLTRIRAYFLALVGHNTFLEMTVDELMELISLDSIGVNSEIEVFLAVLRWLNHMPEQRQKHLRRLMAAVRFPYMSMSFLFDLKEGCNAENKEEIFSTDPMLLAFHMDPATPKLLENAMTFIGVRLQHDNHGEFIEVCHEHKLKVQYPRKWIFHVGCPYHIYELSYPFLHNFSAFDYNNFISSIQLKWNGDGAVNDVKEATIDIKDPLEQLNK